MKRALTGLLAFRQPEPSDERHATLLELFFDLVFVLALASITSRLGSDPSPRLGSVAAAFGLFTLVYWAWVGQAFYDTRYDPDDVPHRLAVLVAMAGAGAITLGVDDAPHTPVLPIGYLVVRGLLLLLYLRARLSVASARSVTTIYLIGFGAGWLIWLGSLAAPERARPALWIVAFVIELLTPWVGLRRLEHFPVNPSHLPERIRQFTIILLGVTLTGLLDAVPRPPTPPVIVAVVVAFVVPAAIWWVYTAFATARPALPRLRGGQAYTYLHMGLNAALLFLGWSLGRVVAQVAEGPPALTGSLRLLLAGSVAAWMLCGLTLQWVSLRAVSGVRMAITFSSIAAVTAIAVSVTEPGVVLGLLAVTLVSYTVAVSRRFPRARP